MDIGSSNLKFQLGNLFLPSCCRLLSKQLPKTPFLCMHPCTSLNHLLLFHSFSPNFIFFHLPLSIFGPQQWCPWPPSIMLFLIQNPLIISFATVVFFVLMLRSLSLWIWPTVALWMFWESVMSNSSVLFMTIMLSLPCMGVFMLLMHLSISFQLVHGLSCLFSSGSLMRVFYPQNHPKLPGFTFSAVVINNLSFLKLVFLPPVTGNVVSVVPKDMQFKFEQELSHLLLLLVSPSTTVLFSQLLNTMLIMWHQI